MSARKVAAPEVPLREPIDLGPLADSKKAGVMFKPEVTPDAVFNQTCPDWCELIGRHMRTSTEQSAHWSPFVYAPMTGMRGYETDSRVPGECEAHFALHLKRVVGAAAPLVEVLFRHGNRDEERVSEKVGQFDLDGARQLIDCLQVLIAAAEAES